MKLEELKSGEDYNKEILKLIQKLNISEENVELYKTGFHDMKRERDELINNLDKGCNMSLNIEGQLHDAIKDKAELKKEVEKLNKLIEIKNKALKGEGVIIENQKSTIKALRLQADEYFELWQDAIKQ